MTVIRRNVFNLGGDWADPILWYARGVQAMKARPLEDPTSWTFYAAIHGVRRWMWDFYGFTQEGEAEPSQQIRTLYWFQCQHQSWYFLPWHRGYLLALEKQIQWEIKQLGGPHDEWALPYWNYFGSGQNYLPPAFQTPDWPDGQGDNPLFVTQRWGPLALSTPFDISSQTNLNPMGEPEFAGPANGGNPGFGGPRTGFNWNGGTSGRLEMDPHNIVHGLVGGQNPAEQFPPDTPLADQNLHGVMADPAAAALDPIFYLHHCNIDRLWQSWNFFPRGKPSPVQHAWKNPTDPQWLDGPTSIGERKFVMPNPDKSEWVYVPKEMEDILALGYDYEDLIPGTTAVPPIRLAGRVAGPGIVAAAGGGRTMASTSKTEMIGASDGRMALAGSAPQRTVLRTAPEARARVSASLVGDRDAAPDRVFLNLENITGLAGATIFQVYVGLPEDADPAESGQYLAGGVSLFGVTEASDPDGQHAGNGINATLEISEIVDKLHLEGNFEVDELAVEIVPFGTISTAARIRIGRISLYRQFD